MQAENIGLPIAIETAISGFSLVASHYYFNMQKSSTPLILADALKVLNDKTATSH